MATLIFDFDGTIVDSFETAITLFNDYAQTHDLPLIKPGDYEKLRSLSSKQIFQLIKKYHLRLPAVIASIRKQLRSRMATLKPILGLPETLLKLRESQHHLGILTTNSKENVELFIESTNLDLFDFIYSESSWFSKSKALKKLLKHYHLAKEETFYIGDETRDIQAAKKNHIHSIAVTWGFNNKTVLADENPDFLIDRPQEILALKAL